MKKIYLSAVAGMALLCASLNANAQDPSIDRWTDSGSNTVISSLSGSVGINTGTPISGTKLDVRGNIFQTPTISNNISQFIGIGDSFGQCDIYGFRAQKSTNVIGLPDDDKSTGTSIATTNIVFVNLGLQQNSATTSPFPVLSYNSNLEVQYDNNSNGCGIRIAKWGSNFSAYQLDVSGHIRATSLFVTSDARLKRDFRKITGAMDMINMMNPVSYLFDRDKAPERNFSEGRSVGFKAQEIREILPEAVSEDEEGYLGVNYNAVIPVLVAALQEQQARINELEQRVAAGPAANPNGVDKLEKIELFQNQPNPFDSETSIRLNLPQNVQNATLYIYDMNGKQIKELNLEERGQVSARIDGGELGAGMYIYALVADGEAVDSKRMILTR
ncbi:MAG: tail fiber domain-containing protein [Cyclobacteriaceae bacterium]